jgi:nucleoside-diphosphate-sugar epimerase
LSVRRLIHFSTVTAYGAHADNSLVSPFRENAPLSERDYLYGSHKREIEGLPMSWCCAARRSAAPMAASPSAASASCRP